MRLTASNKKGSNRKRSDRLRIILIAYYLPPGPGGAGNLLMEFCRELTQICELRVICGAKARYREFDHQLNFPIRRVIRPLPKELPGRIFWAADFVSLTLIYLIYGLVVGICFQPDIIWTGNEGSHMVIVGWLLKRLLARPWVCFAHGEQVPIPEARYTSARISSALLPKADSVLANSSFTASRLKAIGCQRVTVIHPGVDTDFFQPGNQEKARLRLGFPLDRKILLSVGRLDPRKGHLSVIDILPSLRHDLLVRHDLQVLYIIIGDGKCRKRIKQRINELGLEHTVHLLEPVGRNCLISAFQAADIFVLPNMILTDGDAEGFGMVFLEASACGLPVIGGRSGGATDAIADGKSGYLVDPDDRSDLLTHLCKILKDRDLAEKLGQCGRQRCLQDFQWAKSARLLHSVFTTLARS
ncbi:MAG: glycosyltransferase family 4 protein [bacterium]